MKLRPLAVLLFLLWIPLVFLLSGPVRAPTPVHAVQEPPFGVSGEPLESALRRISFPVWLPTWLPFTPATPFAFVINRPNGVQTIYIDYVNPRTRDFVEISITNYPVTMISERYKLEKVIIGGKYEGVFIDNGVAQMLSWNQEGISIMITASRPDHPYPVSTLLQIAAHLERVQ
ncbi:hypothetical protein [Thermoflexus hugenholtzii]